MARKLEPGDPYYNIESKIAKQLQRGGTLLATKVKQYNGADEYGGLYSVTLGAYTPAVNDTRYLYQMICIRKPSKQREEKMRKRGIDTPPPQSSDVFTLAILAAKAFVAFVGVEIAREAARETQRTLDEQKEMRDRQRLELISRVNHAVGTDPLAARMKEQG